MVDQAEATNEVEDETEVDYALRDRVVAAAIEATKNASKISIFLRIFLVVVPFFRARVNIW